MASAWSRISSKVIAHPPYADEACRRWCGNWQGYSGTFIPHIVDKRKQEVLGEVTLFPQTRGGLCHACLIYALGRLDALHFTTRRQLTAHLFCAKRSGICNRV